MYLKPKTLLPTTKHASTYHFKKDDLVRISHNSVTFQRSYDEQFSKEIFKIHQRKRIDGIPVYRITDMLIDSIKGLFYENELQKVRKEDALWFIEKIIKKRKRRNGDIELYVKYDGFPN